MRLSGGVGRWVGWGGVGGMGWVGDYMHACIDIGEAHPLYAVGDGCCVYEYEYEIKIFDGKLERTVEKAARWRRWRWGGVVDML